MLIAAAAWAADCTLSTRRVNVPLLIAAAAWAADCTLSKRRVNVPLMIAAVVGLLIVHYQSDVSMYR